RRSTAVTVTSAARSGVLQSSRKDTLARIWRYSGIYRPAWRISHTGVYGVGSWRQARSRGEGYSSGLSWPGGSTCVERCDDSDTPVAFHEGSNIAFIGPRPCPRTPQLYKSQRTPSRSARLPLALHRRARLMAARSSSDCAGAASTIGALST